MSDRNVLFVTADQWRADFLGAAGFPATITPAIDRLAAEGVLFRRHFANMAPCGPSRASIWTGMYGHNHRSVLNGTPLDAGFTNLALEVRRAGYDPVLFGYTDTSADPRGRDPADPALTSYEGTLPGFAEGQSLHEDGAPWLAYLAAKGYTVPGPGLAVYEPADGAAETLPTEAPARFAAEHSETAWLTDLCLAHLRRHVAERPGRPFFVHLSLLRPHPPWIACDPYHAMFEPAGLPAPLPPADGPSHPFVDWQRGRIRQRDFFRRGEGPAAALGAAAVGRIRATYAGLVREVDTHVDRLLAALAELGLADRTLVVLTSDHGEQLGDHGLFGKLGYFDASYRVPLILRDPRRRGSAGRHVDAFTESVDLMPTVLDWLGLPVPAQCDGRPLTPWLDGETPADWRDAAHWMFDFRDPVGREAERRFGLPAARCNLMVRRESRWKYVHFAGLPPLLFDLEADPGERRDRAADPAFAAERLRLAEAMLVWRQAHDYGALSDTMLTRGGPVAAPRHG